MARFASAPALLAALVMFATAACSSPTADDDGICITLPYGEGIQLTVVSAATGASLAEQATVHVLSIDPPRDEVVGQLSAPFGESPLRTADRPGIYELLVVVPGHAHGHARVTVPETITENGICAIVMQRVTISMTPA